MSTVKDEIAKNIRYYRRKSGLTQVKLAEAIGVKHSAVSNWESGQNSIDIELLFKVCDVLNVSVSEIYGVYGNNRKQYSEHEQKVVTAYRAHPEMQSAVDKLLGVPDNSSATVGEDIAETVAAVMTKKFERK